MSIDKLKKESMMKKKNYITHILIILFFTSCQAMSTYHSTVYYTAERWGDGYKITHGNMGRLAYTAERWGDGYRIIHGNMGKLAYTVERWGDGYKITYGNMGRLAYTAERWGDGYRIIHGNMGKLAYTVERWGDGYRIYAVSSPKSSSETESDKKTEDFLFRMIEI